MHRYMPFLTTEHSKGFSQAHRVHPRKQQECLRKAELACAFPLGSERVCAAVLRPWELMSILTPRTNWFNVWYNENTKICSTQKLRHSSFSPLNSILSTIVSHYKYWFCVKAAEINQVLNRFLQRFSFPSFSPFLSLSEMVTVLSLFTHWIMFSGIRLKERRDSVLFGSILSEWFLKK